MPKIKLSPSNLLSGLVTFTIGLMLMFFGMVAVGNQPEIYPDWIVETVAQIGTNETGELRIFWTLLLLGIPCCLFINHWFKKKNHNHSKIKNANTTSQTTNDQNFFYLISLELVLNLINLIFFLINGYFITVLALLTIVVFFNYLIDKTKIKEGLVLAVFLSYALLALVAVANFLGFETVPSSNLILIVATILDLIILWLNRYLKNLMRIIQILQIFIPFNILLYACRRYLTDDGTTILSLPKPANYLFGLLIIAMVVYAIYKIFCTRHKQNLSLDKIILLPTIILIFILNSVSTNTSLILPTDLHHTGEEIISYQQIVSQGQSPYIDYFPVSGLFPVLIGSVLEIFGGNMTAFNLSHAIYMAIFAGITIYFVSKHLSKFDTLIVALCFSFSSYDRAVWIALSILILMLPKLITRRNLWLKIWLWLCFIGGLYYPSFGGAILVGTLPFAVVQFFHFVKSGELKINIRNWRFYVSWVLCITPILVCAPLLLNIAKHVMLYSSQTNLADGISVFGQKAPAIFLPYLENGPFDYIRYAVYYALRYCLPMFVVWLIALLGQSFFKKKDWKEQLSSPQFLILSASILSLLVGYTGTMVRQDPDAIVSRATHLILPIFGIIIFIFIKNYTRQSLMHYLYLAIIIGIVVILGYSPITRNNLTSRYAYNVRSTETAQYIPISTEVNASIPRLGQGFALASEVEKLSETNTRTQILKSYDSDLTFYGWGKLGTYYILDVPTVGQPSDYAAKSFQTNKETIDAIKKNRPVIGLELSSNLINYYLYNWIMLNDDYLYSSEFKAFLPIELYEKIYGHTKAEDKTHSNWRTLDTGRVANSMGQSLSSLQPVLTKSSNPKITETHYDEKTKTTTIKLVFDEPTPGNNHDMLYLDFSTPENGLIWPDETSNLLKIFSKQHPNDSVYVRVSWGNHKNDQMINIFGTGKLLIPLGANPNWLLSSHQNLTITIENASDTTELRNFQFYELKKEE